MTGPTERIRSAATLGLLAVSTMLGCVGEASNLTRRDAGADPFARLIAAAEAEVSGSLVEIPPPPGVPEEALRPHTPRDIVAHATLGEALELVGDHLPEIPTAPAAERELTPEQLDEAQRLYLLAREQYLAGEHFASLQTLEQVRWLDPRSVEPIRLAAHNYLASTGSDQAIARYREILAITPDDAEAVLRLGLHAADRGQWNEAARCFARFERLSHEEGGLAAIPTGHRPLARRIARERFGDVLTELGFDRAAVEAWAGAPPVELDLHSPLFADQARRLVRQDPQRRVARGDALARLEQIDAALDAYRDAREAAGADLGAIVPRIVHLQLRRQRPNAAAVALLNAMQEDLDSTQLSPLIPYVAPYVGEEALGEAILELAKRHPDALPLALAAADLLPPAQADRLIVSHLADAPEDARVHAAVIEWAVERGQRARALGWIVQLAHDRPIFDRQWARQLMALSPDPDSLVEEFNSLPESLREEVPGRLVLAHLLFELGHLDRADGLVRQLQLEVPDDPRPRLLACDLAFAQDDPIGARRALESIGTPEQLPPLYTYAVAERFVRLDRAEHALAIVRGLRSDDALPLDVRRHRHAEAFLLIQLDRHAEAETILRRAIDEDPTDEAAYAMLLPLYGPSGELTDSTRFAQLARSLVEHLPQSRTLRFLRAQQDEALGRADQAAVELLQLAAEFPTDAGIVEALGRVWIDQRRFSEAESWLRARLAERPNDRRLLATLNDVLVAAERHADALELLRQAHERNPLDPRIGSLYERALRQRGRADEAMRIARRRCERWPQGIPRELALARLAVERDDPTSALSHLQAAWGLRGPDSRQDLERILPVALPAADRAGGPEIWRFIANAVDQQKSTPEGVGMVARQARLQALLELREPMPLIRAEMSAIVDALPEQAPELVLAVVGILKESDRDADAEALAREWLDRSPLDERWVPLAEWRLALAVNEADADRIIEILRALDDAGLLDRLELRWLTNSDDRSLAQILYLAAGEIYENHRAASERVLEEVLRVQPDHALANNDLGYSIADRGERLEDAHRMLLRAYRQHPDNPSILDSLAWVRYKLGALRDDQAPDGLGAITLLRRSLQTPRGRFDPVVHDHLGDALWRAGERDLARQAWEAAVSMYELHLADAGGEGAEAAERARLIEEHYGPVAHGARRKLSALDEGQEPPVASWSPVEELGFPQEGKSADARADGNGD